MEPVDRCAYLVADFQIQILIQEEIGLVNVAVVDPLGMGKFQSLRSLTSLAIQYP